MLRAQVGALLDEAERVDAEEDAGSAWIGAATSFPRSSSAASSGLEMIREAKAALEAEAAEARRRAAPSSSAQGRKPRRPPHGRDPFEPKPSAQRNFTDPESKIMKTSDGSFHQCYNGQAMSTPRR